MSKVDVEQSTESLVVLWLIVLQHRVCFVEFLLLFLLTDKFLD